MNFCSQKSQNNRKKFFNQKRIFEKQSPKIETGKNVGEINLSRFKTEIKEYFIAQAFI